MTTAPRRSLRYDNGAFMLRLPRARPARLRTRADLERFFAACDGREQAREPDWDEHLEVIDASRRDGLPAP